MFKFLTDNELNKNDFINKDELKRIQNLYKSINSDDEFEVSFYNTRDSSKRINLQHFIDIINYIKFRRSSDKLVLEVSKNLDTIYTEEGGTVYRVVLEDNNNINSILNTSNLYSRRNHTIFNVLMSKKLSNEKGIKMYKKQRDMKNVVDFKELDVRLRVFKELDFTKSDIDKLKKLNYESESNIVFRYKTRISLFLYNKNGVVIRMDLTDVKMSKDINKISNSVSNYELELELNTNKKNLDLKYLDIFYKELFNTLKILEKSKYLITKSEKKMVLDMYNVKFGNNKFMGRNPKSLEIQHVIDIIPNNYTVTDKADGDRYFLLIFNQKIYLLSTNLNVIYTGITLSNKQNKYNNTILDGEYVYLKKYNRFIFMVFDCLYKSDESILNEESFFNRLKHAEEVINKCFIFNKQKGNKYNIYSGKYNSDNIKKFYKKDLINFFNDLNNDIKKDKNLLLVRRKFFIPVLGVEDNEIFQNSSLLYDSCMLDNNINMPYSIDGMIFHPIQQKYSFSERDSKFSEYKFKPPDQNSIDFYITFEKDKQNNILKVYDNSNDNEIKNRPYVICYLHVGKRFREKEVPTLFLEKEGLHVVYLFLQEGKENPLDKEGAILKDNTVVEFYYDTNPNIVNDKYRWIPMRTRYDKTESVQRFGKKYGNYESTAINIWRSIKNPFTILNIRKLSDISTYEKNLNFLRKKIDHSIILTETKHDIYYQTKTNIGKWQRRFHNFVKDLLIQTYIKSHYNEKFDVLDIGVGVGGDLMKFYMAKVGSLVGIDPDSHGLTSSTDGAVSRYKQLSSKRNLTNFPKMTFIQADATIPFNYTAQLKKFNNMSFSNKKLLQKVFPDSGSMKFDRINCQFAVHYFLGNELSWNNFCNNINMCLKDDGIIVFTCFDGEVVNNIFKKNNNDKLSVYYTDKKGNKKLYFEMIKKYDNTDKKHSLGNAIDVYISLFMQEGNYQTEYLVEKKYFIEQLKNKCNLELVDTNTFDHLYNIHEKYFKDTIKYEDNDRTRKFLFDVSKYYDMSTDENIAGFELSKLNRFFVFKKKKTKNKVGGSSHNISKYLGKKMDCDLYNNNDRYSYYTSLYKSITNDQKDTNINNFFNNLNIHLIPDSNIDEKSIKNINKNVRYISENSDVKGLNTIILEENEDNNVYISGFGNRKNKINKLKPSIILYKKNNKYFSIYKKKEKKNVYLFKTTGKLLKKIIDKYNI